MGELIGGEGDIVINLTEKKLPFYFNQKLIQNCYLCVLVLLKREKKQNILRYEKEREIKRTETTNL